MDNYSLSHTKWSCQYHIVFIPKYRKKIMYGKVKIDIREIIKTDHYSDYVEEEVMDYIVKNKLYF